MAGNGESADRTAARKADAGTDTPDDAAPPIELTVQPEYWIGFPMIVQVTVENRTKTRSWYALPSCRLLRAPGPVAFRFTDPAGRSVELPAASTRAGEGPARGFDLEPGQSRTMLFDISELEPELAAGSWTLRGVYTLAQGSSESPAVPVTLVAPTKEDAAGAARLRAANSSGAASWSRLLDEGLADLPEVDLSPEAWRQLAFHEAVHRAAQLRTPLADVDPATFDGFDGTPLAGEAELLRLEILEARGDSTAAALRASISERRPGLKWRLAELAKGRGFLADIRKRLDEKKPRN